MMDLQHPRKDLSFSLQSSLFSFLDSVAGSGKLISLSLLPCAPLKVAREQGKGRRNSVTLSLSDLYFKTFGVPPFFPSFSVTPFFDW